jgi:hypothetical protein
LIRVAYITQASNLPQSQEKKHEKTKQVDHPDNASGKLVDGNECVCSPTPGMHLGFIERLYYNRDSN